MSTCVCHTPLDAGHLCARCRAATAGRLTRIPILYRLLEPALHPAAAPPSYGRVRLVEAPLPVSLRVLSLRGPGGIVGILEEWRCAMQAARGWGRPALAGSIESRVHRAARGLEQNLAWIADSWAQAGLLATVLRRLDDEVTGIVCPPDTLTFERGTLLGPCPATTAPDTLCGATLRHYRSTGVTCRWCGTAYPSESWMDLKTWMDEDEQDDREALLAG
ncbi:hypothetical protein [Streptomyces sp. NPDC058612]|uniref:hypothetical protein n=1 Tax=Streptomyces sp. NPDC058612 TaxID=3346555 RepID=UPI0036565F04